MHTLLFLEPAHFHATLTLGRPHPRVSDEVIVYASEGADRRDFLALVERFNRRAERPTSWRPLVVDGGDLLSRLVSERRGDVVVLAGRNGGKARTVRRLHEAGFHVLADKPWLVEPDDLADIRASLPGWPLVMEIMTGRHDVAARLFKRLVDARDVFGDFRHDAPAIELDSTHCLEKLVDGVPLRRPWWFFDVRVQGSGAVDIPTHVVDQAQWLLEGHGVAAGEAPRLMSARGWPTPVPLDAFRRITGEPAFPGELRPLVAGDELSYRCNAELAYAIGPVAARATVSWRVSSPDRGGDTHATAARGTRADAERVRRAMLDVVDAVLRELPGVEVAPAGVEGIDVTIPGALDAGHESHFALVLDDFLTTIDGGRWPAALAERTLAKYALLAHAAAATGPNAGPGFVTRHSHETERER